MDPQIMTAVLWCGGYLLGTVIICIILCKIAFKYSEETTPAPQVLREPTLLEIETFKQYVPIGGRAGSDAVNAKIDKWLKGLKMADGYVICLRSSGINPANHCNTPPSYDVAIRECRFSTNIHESGMDAGQYLEPGTPVKAFCIRNAAGEYVIQAVYRRWL